MQRFSRKNLNFYYTVSISVDNFLDSGRFHDGFDQIANSGIFHA